MKKEKCGKRKKQKVVDKPVLTREKFTKSSKAYMATLGVNGTTSLDIVPIVDIPFDGSDRSRLNKLIDIAIDNPGKMKYVLKLIDKLEE